MIQVIKLQVRHLRSTISSLRALNDMTDEQMQAFCQKNKKEALEGVIKGLEDDIDQAIGAKSLAGKIKHAHKVFDTNG